jgi:hypothetical protein
LADSYGPQDRPVGRCSERDDGPSVVLGSGATWEERTMLSARVQTTRLTARGLAAAAVALVAATGVVNAAQAQTGAGDLPIPPSPPDTLASLLAVVPASSCLHDPARCGATRIVLVPSLTDATWRRT